MYLGKIVEHGPREELFRLARHPYTQALLSAVALPDPRAARQQVKIRLRGDLPSPATPPSGCVFRTRCPMATERCAAEIPALREMAEGHSSACHYAEEV